MTMATHPSRSILFDPPHIHRRFRSFGTTPRSPLKVFSALVNNAFTPVSAKRSFARSLPAENNRVPAVPPPTVVKPAAEKSKRDWPLPVRHYVQRAFATENSIPGISRQEMEVKLKQIISESAERNTLLTVDWDSLLLPQQLISKERENALKKSESLLLGRDIFMLTVNVTNSQSINPPSKKRKSSDLEPTKNGHESNPPWRNTNNYNMFEDRISYPDKRQRVTGKGSSKSHHNLDNRKKRFDDGISGSSPLQPPFGQEPSPSSDEGHGPVIGRCQDLEKQYFRLTSAPNPDTVRPLAVLEKTLAFLKTKWKKENNYSYICDQFKSLRQDLTVQHIKNDFTVNVYEIHARIALEKGDLGEYNQCQTQLRALYSQNLGGHPNEFRAYRILYFIHTSNRTDMNDVLADLTPAEKNDPAVKHALDTRSALALGNYHRFFQLYLDTPNMGAYLMDMFINRERLAALSKICKSYKADVGLRFLTEELGFESDEESARFVCEHNGQSFLEERDGGVRLLTGKALSFFESAKALAFKRVDIKGQI